MKSPTNFAQMLQFRLEVLLRAVNLRHGTHGFTSLPKEVILRISTLWKNPSTPAGIEPANLGSRGEYDNHWTSGVDKSQITIKLPSRKLSFRYFKNILLFCNKICFSSAVSWLENFSTIRQLKNEIFLMTICSTDIHYLYVIFEVYFHHKPAEFVPLMH